MYASSAQTFSLPDPASQPEFYQGVVLKRGLAWVFDAILIAILSALVLPFTAFTGIFFFPGLMLVMGFFYRWFTLAGGSSTWGMRLMSIELREADGGADVRHAEIEADHIMPVFPVVGEPLPAQLQRLPVQGRVGGHHHPALAGRDGLVSEEAEGGDIPEGADMLRAHLGPEGFRAVLDQPQAVAAGQEH